MSTYPSLELTELMLETDTNSSQDKLERITRKMREDRDLKLEIKDLESRIEEKKKQFNTLIQKELVDDLNEVGQAYLKLPREGNLPSFSFKLKPFYKANINNESEDSVKAYEWLENEGEGSLIRRNVSVSLGKDSEEIQEKLTNVLEDLGVDYDLKFGIPWNTLTSWLKERHRQYLADLKNPNLRPEERTTMPPLEWFGASIGEVVEIKEEK